MYMHPHMWYLQSPKEGLDPLELVTDAVTCMWVLRTVSGFSVRSGSAHLQTHLSRPKDLLTMVQFSGRGFSSLWRTVENTNHFRILENTVTAMFALTWWSYRNSTAYSSLEPPGSKAKPPGLFLMLLRSYTAREKNSTSQPWHILHRSETWDAFVG